MVASAPAQPLSFSSRQLISAISDPVVLQGVRNTFTGVDPEAGVHGLVVELIDPQLLRVVLGPELAPPWSAALERAYSVIRDLHPADFHDVDQSWRRQRGYWYTVLRSGRSVAEAVEEEAADEAAAAGSHGEVAERPRSRAETSSDRESARKNGSGSRKSRRRVQVAFGDAPDPDPDVETVVVAEAPDEIDQEIIDGEQVERSDHRDGRGARGRRDDRRDDRRARGRAPARRPEGRARPPLDVSGGAAASRGKVVKPSAASIAARHDLGITGGEDAPPVVRGAAAPVSGQVRQGGIVRAYDADPAAGVAAMLDAMNRSYDALCNVRRAWVASSGNSKQWDRWVLPENLAALSRTRSRT